MKKTLVAFAALTAIAGMAQAQSSVTLYGRLDVSVGQVNVKTRGVGPLATTATNKQTVVDPSQLNTSFWGLKGTEDLGGGLRANFDLQSGLNPDTGAVNGNGPSIFGRKAIVGLSGGFGSIDLGRNYTAYDSLRAATNMIYDSNFATTSDVWASGVADYANRRDNTITYTSPSFGGFSGQLGYAFGENKQAVGNVGNATDTLSLHIKYANGPLLVGYAYQGEKQAQAVATVGQLERKYNLFGASYDFGVAKVVGAYNQAKQGALKDKEYEFGVSVPFGAAAIAGGYSNSKTTGSTAKGTGFSLVGTYDLSKRTTLYAGVEATKLKNTSATVSEVKRTNFATGVRHVF